MEEDVLRARIRTVGVQEYQFHLETGPDKGREWRIYDCGRYHHLFFSALTLTCYYLGQAALGINDVSEIELC